MAFDSEVGSFSANTSTGNQTVTLSGSFTPKAIILYTSKQTAVGNAANLEFSIGAATGTAERWSSWVGMEDTTGNSNSVSMFKNDKVFTLWFLPASPATTFTALVESEADFVSFGAGQFTINWTNAPGNAWEINYIAIGGSDVTNIKAGTVGFPSGTGNQATTDPGFQPDLVLFNAPYESSGTPGTGMTHGRASIGAAVSSTERAVAAFLGENNRGVHDDYSYQSATGVIMIPNNEATLEAADFVSMDATGFTINWSAALAGTSAEYGYLAIEGPQVAVGQYTTQTSTGNFSETGVGFQPGLLINWSAFVSGHAADCKFVLGAATGSTERNSVAFEKDESAETADKRYSTTRIYSNLSAGTPTLNGDIDFVSFDADGFTLNQTDADPTGQTVNYVTIGNTAPPAPNPGIIHVVGI